MATGAEENYAKEAFERLQRTDTSNLTPEELRVLLADVSDALELALVDKELAEEQLLAYLGGAACPQAEEEPADKAAKEEAPQEATVSKYVADLAEMRAEECEQRAARAEEQLAMVRQQNAEQRAALDAFVHADALISRLTQQNISLGDENAALRSAAADFEEYKLVADALEHELEESMRAAQQEATRLEDECVERKRVAEQLAEALF